MYYLVLFCCRVFSPFSFAITLLGKRANLSTFCTSVRFALILFHLYSQPLGVWEGLRYVIVALPGHFIPIYSTGTRPCFMFVYSTGARIDNPPGQMFDPNKNYFNRTLYVSAIRFKYILKKKYLF